MRDGKMEVFATGCYRDKVKPDDSNANEPFKPKNIPTAKYYVSVGKTSQAADVAGAYYACAVWQGP